MSDALKPLPLIEVEYLDVMPDDDQVDCVSDEVTQLLNAVFGPESPPAAFQVAG